MAEGSSLLTFHVLYPAASVNKDLTLAVTSDRGLCGGLNSNITKYTKTLMKITASEAGGDSEMLTCARGYGESCSEQAFLFFVDPHLIYFVPGEGETKSTVLASIGDKGRSQLTRTESKIYVLGVAVSFCGCKSVSMLSCSPGANIYIYSFFFMQDAYKIRVTFSQVCTSRWEL
jgi:hypothetical protein